MNPPEQHPERRDAIAVQTSGPVARPAYIEAPAPYARELMDEAPSGGLLEYWGILRRHKGAVLLFAVLGLLAAVFFTLPQTPVYQARASIEIQSMNQDFMNSRQLNPVAEGSTDYNTNDIQTHIKLMQSDALIQRVIAKLNQAKPRDFSPRTDRISSWRRALGLKEPTPVDAREQAIGFASGSLRIRASGQTRVVEITSDSTDPQTASDFANTLGSEYIDQTMEARWQMNQRTGEWLEKQLEDMRIKLEHSEDDLQRYARQTGLLFTGDKEKQNVSEEKLRQLQEELSRAQADRISKQSRYEMAQSSPPESLADVLNDASLQGYQSKLTDLRREEAELGATYRSEYSKVKKTRAQIATLESALQRERKSILERIGNDYREAQRREKLLVADYGNQAKLVTTESEKSVQYNILKREVDTTRQLYEGMLQHVKEAGIASAMRASNIRIVDRAEPPRFPYKPSLPRNGTLGLMAGMFLGVAFVVIRERSNRAIQAPGDAQFYLNVPELGVVPDSTAHGLDKLRYSRRRRLAASSGESASEPSLSTVTDKISPERVELVVSQKKHSVQAESFRVILTSILFSGENGGRPRVLVLTSAEPGEGKTTVVSNLAVALAEIKRSVLVIDADLRRPRIHDVFGVSNQRGLSTLLEQARLTPEALEGIVQESAIPGVHVLPSGPTAAPGLLHSGVLPGLLKGFKNQFDMVLIDTPPMLQMPDARVMARHADAVVMVIKAGETTRDAVVAARERFAVDGARVLGTILNKWNPKRSPNGYYGNSGGYGYYRAYGNHYYAAPKDE